MRRLLLRAYPPAWRRRYGDELELLLTETGTPPRVIVDVLRAATRARAASLLAALKGDEPMQLGPLARHPGRLALLALLLMAPTLTLVVASILGHELGISAVASVADPIIESVTAPRIIDLALVAAPAVSLVLAVLPILAVGLRAADGSGADESPVATVSVRLRAANVLVALLALLLGLTLAGHIVLETVLEAGR